jgi:hypothetical protein
MIAHMDLEKMTAAGVADAFTVLFTSVYVALATEEEDVTVEPLSTAEAVVENPPAKARRSRKTGNAVPAVQRTTRAEQEPSDDMHALPSRNSGDGDEDYA